MRIKIVMSSDFQRGWRQLSPQMQKIVKSKISRLVENPGHPSLNTHRVRQTREDIWVCYISNSMRLLYEYKEGTLYLWGLGSHSIVDRVHLRKFVS
jgi:addiction module RelE/StbE family toxin